MRALLQRVSQASVKVNGEVAGSIGRGLVVLVGIEKGDSPEDARYLADRIVHLRIFPDAQGKFNLSALDVGGEVLVVSQFTLLADTKKGHRPSFDKAASPQEAEALYNRLISLLQGYGLKVETGRFREKMLVEIYNDGPVTISLDSRER